MARWRNHFSQLFNVHRFNYVRQTEIHTAETLVPESSSFEVQMSTEKLKRHKATGIDEIPEEFIKARDRKIRSEITKLVIVFGIKRNCLRMEGVDHCTYL